MVVAARSGPSGELLARAVSDAEVLQIRPLGQQATGTLVRSAASGADEEVCRACYEVTKGNPFFVLELARATRAEGLEAGPANAKRLLDWSPENVTRFVGTRLGSLSPSAQAVARAAAVLGQTRISPACCRHRLPRDGRRVSRRRRTSGRRCHRPGAPARIRAPHRPLGRLRRDAP